MSQSWCSYVIDVDGRNGKCWLKRFEEHIQERIRTQSRPHGEGCLSEVPRINKHDADKQSLKLILSCNFPVILGGLLNNSRAVIDRRDFGVADHRCAIKNLTSTLSVPQTPADAPKSLRTLSKARRPKTPPRPATANTDVSLTPAGKLTIPTEYRATKMMPEAIPLSTFQAE